MKSYTRTYLKYFGYGIDDFIPCEIPGCQKRAIDICHIESKKQRPDLVNDITNLMAKCREHHLEFGDRKQLKEYLKQIHNAKMRA